MAVGFLAGESQMSNTMTRRSIIFAWVVCSLGAIFYCYEYFLRISPSVMTSQLMSLYHLTGAQVGNLSAFYYHAYVPMQLIVGIVMDRYGPRRLLTFACLLCAVGTYLFASGGDLNMAQFGRFLVGMGSAFAFVGALKLATIWLPPNRFALVSGIIMCLGMVGAMAGDILLHKMVDAIGWNITLYASAAIGVFLAIILWTVVRDVSTHQMSFHIHKVGFAELFTGMLRTVMNLQFWLNGFVGFLLYLSLSAFAELWAIPYLMQAQQLPKIHAVVANSMVFLGWAIGGPFWGWFSDHIQLRRMPIMLASVGGLVLITILLYVPGLSLLSIYLLLFGFGFLSAVQILVFSICREISHIRITGTAVSLTNAIVMLGGSLLQPIIGKLLDMQWTGGMLHGARVYSISAYQMALSVMPISVAITIIIMLFMRETHCKVSTDY